MALLIDGYNLLHATDIFGTEPGNFQQSREALLAFLAAALAEKERKEATIVFDATQAPPGLPHSLTQEAMTVRFARNYLDADALIEELIEQHPAARSLLVVSSDHRVQRAARRRGASFVDSERWYSDLWRQRVHARQQQSQAIPEKPIGELSAGEIAYWVKEFGACSSENAAEHQVSEPSKNPFPPGYGEDLLGNDSESDHDSPNC
ncbi:MAG: NYN domain-containing protein [Pirellulales bacterium]|nr:NYN domain-containing protein [Pirellulales bacterium]